MKMVNFANLLETGASQTAIVHATPTKAQPTPSAWNHEHDRLSDFLPIAWHQIAMRNGTTFLET